jgi:phage terminase large subunit GpA-like protein
MDAFNDPKIEMVTLMTSSQIGKTEIVNNIIGYYIEHDPAPLLLIMPTLEMAMAWSKDRFAPMLRDTPSLKGKVTDAKAKDSGNTILHKIFPGGHITVAGANSPASLASRPVRIVLFDEVDRFPPSAGTEGDPVKLGTKRALTFWNRKIFHNSTPTVQGVSRIEALWEESDQRHFYVPCPRCGHSQILIFSPNSVFGKLTKGFLKFDEKNLSWVCYECENCHQDIDESKKLKMLMQGKWSALYPERIKHAGFHINELYSPWSSWKGIVESFIEAKKRTETLKVWVNTTLGETWTSEETYTISDEKLAARIEAYENVPMGVLVLTAGIDVQDDRLECLLKGYGLNDESWLIDYKTFYGSPARQEVWNELDQFLHQEWQHENGLPFRLDSACIDSAGHFTQNVYSFVKQQRSRRIHAIVGRSGTGRPLVGKPTKNNRQRIPLFIVGVDTAKELIYARLQIDEVGQGYMHFNRKCDEAYFKQLTAEKQVTTFSKGFPTKVWIKVRARNEALDCEVYALAAFTLLNANMPAIERNLKTKVANAEQTQSQTAPEEHQQPSRSLETEMLKRIRRRNQGLDYDPLHW